MILFPQLNSRAKHGNIDYGNILWEQNAGFRGPSSTRCGMFLQTNVCGTPSRPAGRLLSDLALRLRDCQPDSFTWKMRRPWRERGDPPTGSWLVYVLDTSNLA